MFATVCAATVVLEGALKSWKNEAAALLSDLVVAREVRKYTLRNPDHYDERSLRVVSDKFQNSAYWDEFAFANQRVTRALEPFKECENFICKIRAEELRFIEEAQLLLLSDVDSYQVLDIVRIIEARLSNLWSTHRWLAAEVRQSIVDREKLEAIAALSTWKKQVIPGNAQRRVIKREKWNYIAALISRNANLLERGVTDDFVLKRAYRKWLAAERDFRFLDFKEAEKRLVKILLKLERTETSPWWQTYSDAKMAAEEEQAALRDMMRISDLLFSLNWSDKRDQMVAVFADFDEAFKIWEASRMTSVKAGIKATRTFRELIIYPATKANCFVIEESKICREFVDKITRPLEYIEKTHST